MGRSALIEKTPMRQKMEAIREIKHAHANQLVIDIPDDFLSRELEIIVLPLRENNKKEKPNRQDSFFDFVNQYHLKLPGNYIFVREELYDR